MCALPRSRVVSRAAVRCTATLRTARTAHALLTHSPSTCTQPVALATSSQATAATSTGLLIDCGASADSQRRQSLRFRTPHALSPRAMPACRESACSPAASMACAGRRWSQPAGSRQAAAVLARASLASPLELPGAGRHHPRPALDRRHAPSPVAALPAAGCCSAGECSDRLQSSQVNHGCSPTAAAVGHVAAGHAAGQAAAWFVAISATGVRVCRARVSLLCAASDRIRSRHGHVVASVCVDVQV